MKNAISKNLLRGALLALTASALPVLAGPDHIGLGTGRDGALTVNAANVVINVYAQVTAPLAPGDTAILFGNATGVLAAGDLVMVLQTTGLVPEPASGGPTPVDLTNEAVGRWEFARVDSVAGNTLNLTEPLLHSYAANVTQLIRVPEYTTVTINAGRSITAADWDRATSTGGVVAFLATGTFSNGGSVDVRGRGFRGGQPVNDPSGNLGCTALDEPAPQGAQKGEGIAVGRYGPLSTGRGRVAHGAGGGVCDRAGGGGGGNGGTGGQGGNSELNVDGNRAVGGEGGAALTFNLLDHLMMGGGGGAGHSTDVAAGSGGGIIFIRANQLTFSGSFFANGNSSASATGAGSGGGAGGTIYLRIAGPATCGAIQAIGGAGGSTGSIAIGPGGGGGGGRVLFQKGSGTCTLTATSVIGANPGTQVDPGAPGGASYGATAGANGSSTVLAGGFAVLPTPSVDAPVDGSRINDSTPTYSGTIATPLPSGTEVAISVDGAEVGRATPDGLGNWSFTAATPLANGTHSVNALAINPSQGVQSTRSNTNTFTVDVTPPAVAVTAPADGAQLNNTTPTYSGTVSDDGPGPLTVTVSVDGVSLGNATVTGGTWTFTQPLPLTQGSHTVTATATDDVGNTASDSNTFTMDTTAPAAPVITTPADGANLSTNTPTYSGTAEAGSTVTVIVDGSSVGTTTADASGNWSLTPTASLANGPHTVMATATDTAGNVSPQSNTHTFTVGGGSTIPPAPVVTGPADNTVTDDTTPTISGTAPPNSTVTVFIDGKPVGTTTSDAAGNWTLTPTSALPEGPHLITATTTNAEGTTSSPSNTVRLIVDTGPPDTTIVSGPSGRTESTSALFEFSSSEAGVTYECNLDGAGFVPCSNPVTFAGLSAGEHTLEVRARDAAGNVDPTPARATWTVLPTTVVDRDFLGDGLGCATSRGAPSFLSLLGLGLLALLGARGRRP